MVHTIGRHGQSEENYEVFYVVATSKTKIERRKIFVLPLLRNNYFILRIAKKYKLNSAMQ